MVPHSNLAAGPGTSANVLLVPTPPPITRRIEASGSTALTAMLRFDATPAVKLMDAGVVGRVPPPWPVADNAPVPVKVVIVSSSIFFRRAVIVNETAVVFGPVIGSMVM